MSRFIGLNIIGINDQDKIVRTGSVLLNIDHIISIEAQGKPCSDSVCKVRTLHNAKSFIVEGSMIDLLDVIKRAGVDFHAFDNSKQASQSRDPSIAALFNRLRRKYGTMNEVSRILKWKYSEFYTTDHINGIAQRLKRLEETHDNLKSYPQKRQVLEHLKELDTLFKGIDLKDYYKEQQ